MKRHSRVSIFCNVFAALAMLAMSSNAFATMVDVFAYANSSTGGSGATHASLNFSPGQWFSVTVAPTDLWNAGALPRWSNADGLTGNLFATGTDDSGQANGTLIGNSFGTWTQSGFAAPYGALVGRIGGAFFFIGTNFLGQTATGGQLELFYWDSNFLDNTQFITASVNAVPLPAAAWLLLSGLVGFAALGRRRVTKNV